MEFALKVGAGFLIYWLLRLAGVPLELFLGLGIALAIGWPLGWFVGTLIGDETDVDTKAFKLIGWANLIAWLIPIAGVAVAKLSSSVGKESIKSRLFYDGMSLAGYGLVIVNVALYGHFLKSEALQAEQSEHPAVVHESLDLDDPNRGVRSFARCPYAAQERWTQEEVQANCNREPTEKELREFEVEQQRLQAANS